MLPFFFTSNTTHMKAQDFRVRASSCGKLFTNPRSKKEAEENMGLSKTTISYLQEWVTEQLYGVRYDFETKHTRKGKIIEDDSIHFAKEQLEQDRDQWHLWAKNEEQFGDEHFTGTPDVLLPNDVIDIKSSWDAYTFPLFIPTPDKAYVAQLQTYMALTGRPQAKLVYTLMSFLDEVTGEMQYYENVDPRYRIKVYSFGRDEDFIADARARVELCRNYLADRLIPMVENMNKGGEK